MGWAFNDPGLLAKLEAADDATLDTAPFGVVAMAIDGKVTSYNAAESRLSGLSPRVSSADTSSQTSLPAPTTIW